MVNLVEQLKVLEDQVQDMETETKYVTEIAMRGRAVMQGDGFIISTQDPMIDWIEKQQVLNKTMLSILNQVGSHIGLYTPLR